MGADTRKTIDALSSTEITIRGKLFESDRDSVTILVEGAQYDVLREHIKNAGEIAKAKPGQAVALHVSPEAQIVEKRVISPIALRGVVAGEALGKDARGVPVADDCCNCLCHEGPGFCDCICDWYSQPFQFTKRFGRAIATRPKVRT